MERDSGGDGGDRTFLAQKRVGIGAIHYQNICGNYFLFRMYPRGAKVFQTFSGLSRSRVFFISSPERAWGFLETVSPAFSSSLAWSARRAAARITS